MARESIRSVYPKNERMRILRWSVDAQQTLIDRIVTYGTKLMSREGKAV